jgi:hypothetical protein
MLNPKFIICDVFEASFFGRWEIGNPFDVVVWTNKAGAQRFDSKDAACQTLGMLVTRYPKRQFSVMPEA